MQSLKFEEQPIRRVFSYFKRGILYNLLPYLFIHIIYKLYRHEKVFALAMELIQYAMITFQVLNHQSNSLI